MKKEGLERFLKEKRSVYLDSNLFIYQLEDKQPYSPLTHMVFEMMESGKIMGHTSVLSVMELNVGPYKQGRVDLSFSHLALLQNLRNLKIHPVDLMIGDLAAQYRAHYSFRTPDALHLATAMASESRLFIGNDKVLKKFDKISHIVLDDFI